MKRHRSMRMGLRAGGRIASSLLAGVQLACAPAAAAPVPDAATLATLRMQAARYDRVRLVRGEQRPELMAFVADSAGVRLPKEPKRPSIAAAMTPGEAEIVAWSDIERVEARRTGRLRGAAQGAVVGGIVGLIVTVIVVNNAEGESALAAIGITPAGIFYGGIVGALLGGGGQWRTLYP